MKIKASGRAASILATGLFVCFAAPSQATAATDGSKSVRHHRHYVHHRSPRVVAKSSDSKSDSKKEPAADTVKSGAVDPATLPASVANANAQLAVVAMPADSASAMATRASEIVLAAADAQPPAASQVVAPDQVNDVDRALREETPPQQTTLAMASAEPPAAPAARATESSENSTWDQASLIGKIFIGFGALLTLASAARMFMA
jgi:hypothetical protein